MSYSISKLNLSYKRKVSQEVDLVIEDVLENEIESNANPATNKSNVEPTVQKIKPKSSSKKPWTNCDTNFVDIRKHRVLLADNSTFSDDDDEVIKWSSSEDEAVCNLNCDRSVVDSQNSFVLPPSISSFGSELCSPQLSNDEENELEEISITETQSSPCPIPPRLSFKPGRTWLAKPVCPDFGKNADVPTSCENSQEAEISPSSSPVSNPDVASKPHGTVWLQDIPWQMKTPEKMPESVKVDPGSSKKKCLRGGFADQLRKLESRRKSSQTMWLYEKQRSGFSNKLALHVRQIARVKGLARTHCDIVGRDDPSSSTSGNEDDESDLQTVNSFQRCTLLLSSVVNIPIGEITANCLLNIYPPWQKFRLPAHDEPLVLCPYFVEIVKDADRLEEETARNRDVRLVYRWECPCRNGVCSAEMCPLRSTEPEPPILEPTCNGEWRNTNRIITQK